MTAPRFDFGGTMSRKFIFTNKKYSVKGVMATILGIIDLIALCLAVYLTYRNQQTGGRTYGTTGVLVTVFSLVGLILAILSKYEPDRFYLFTYLGIFLNVLSLIGVSMILFAGAYGL